MKSKALLLFTILALAVFAAGCGSKGASVSDINTEPATAATSSDTDSEESSDDSGDKGKTVEPKVSGSLSSKPKISKASGEPPADLITKDIKKGSGATARSGDKVTVNYVGKNWSNNEEFDTSWGREGFEFTLGEGGVIAGWDEGVAGMKEGGRRLLIIPPDKGYGAQGSPPSIPANETLIFVVDLEKVG